MFLSNREAEAHCDLFNLRCHSNSIWNVTVRSASSLDTCSAKRHKIAQNDRENLTWQLLGDVVMHTASSTAQVQTTVPVTACTARQKAEAYVVRLSSSQGQSQL